MIDILYNLLAAAEHIISSPWYWLGVGLYIVIAPGVIGRIACRWGLHDSHRVPGYPGHLRVVCVRCTKRWEVST